MSLIYQSGAKDKPRQTFEAPVYRCHRDAQHEARCIVAIRDRRRREGMAVIGGVA